MPNGNLLSRLAAKENLSAKAVFRKSKVRIIMRAETYF